MKFRVRRKIKKNINTTHLFKIVSIKDGYFKEGGETSTTGVVGKTWYKIGDAKKAFNIIPDADKKDFKIVELVVKLKEIIER